MAPLKFEEKIKEKLDNRVIKPSNNSWEQLSKRLDDTQMPKKKRDVKKWYSIAAIFVGLLFVTSIIMYQNSIKNNIEPKLVDATFDKESVKIIDSDKTEKYVEERNSKQSNDDLVNNEGDIPLASQKKEDEVKSNSQISLKDLKPKFVEPKAVVEDKKIDVGLAENNENFKVNYQDTVIDKKIIDAKVAEVAAKVKEFEDNNIEVSEEEINQLLIEAQREITTEKMFESGKVSASALLEEVEQELDDTFKQRVFEALKTGFRKVKTAVVQRKN